MKIKTVTAEAIRVLRHEALRKGQPFSSTIYDKDNNSKTFHLACVEQEKIICCATFYPEPLRGVLSKNPYRLRGMATNKNYRRMGCGKRLMIEAFKKLKEKKGDLLWCNARLVAVEFYKTIGFKTKGELFDIKDIGPHYLMFKKT